MTSAYDHTKTLLAAIIPHRADLLEYARRNLTPQQIPDRILANLFTLLERYSEITGAVLTRSALAELLISSRADAGTIAAYQEIYDELAERPADEAGFRWSLQQIRELAAERATLDALNQAMTILTRGTEDERGERLSGHSDARSHLLSRFSDIDRDLAKQQAPEGDIRADGEDIWAEYVKQKDARLAGRGRGIQFGVPDLDTRLGGLHPGELVLLVGYCSDGKTSMAVQLAWSAAVEQGKNVLFLTTETIRSQVRRRIIARHSCLPCFGAGDGINSRDIKDATLSEDEERRLAEVISDFNDNPGYGSLYIAQVPRAASMTYVESKAIRVAQRMPVDLVIMDYLALLKAEAKRITIREELSAILKSAKQLSTTLNDGAGVPFVSPWQVSRTARIEAEQKGSYTLNALSETAETSNSADTIISLLAPLDNESRRTKVKAQVMKHRDGEKANAIELMVDYATSKFTGQRERQHTIDEIFDPLSVLI